MLFGTSRKKGGPTPDRPGRLLLREGTIVKTVPGNKHITPLSTYTFAVVTLLILVTFSLVTRAIHSLWPALCLTVKTARKMLGLYKRRAAAQRVLHPLKT